MEQKDLKQLSDNDLLLLMKKNRENHNLIPSDDSEEARKAEWKGLIESGTIQREIGARQTKLPLIVSLVNWSRSPETRPTEELQEKVNSWLFFAGFNEGLNKEQIIANRKAALENIINEWKCQFVLQGLNKLESIVYELAKALPDKSKLS